MDKTAQQNRRDLFQAMKEADRIFSEKQQLKAQRIREDERKLQNFNVTLTVMFKLIYLHHVITKNKKVKIMAIVLSYTGCKTCHEPATKT